MLPSKANNGQDDTKGQLAVLESADEAGAVVRGDTAIAQRHRDDRLYVHAKVGSSTIAG